MATKLAMLRCDNVAGAGFEFWSDLTPHVPCSKVFSLPGCPLNWRNILPRIVIAGVISPVQCVECAYSRLSSSIEDLHHVGDTLVRFGNAFDPIPYCRLLEMKSLYGSMTRSAVNFLSISGVMILPSSIREGSDMFLDVAGQVIHYARQGHFRVSGLEAAPQRGLNSVLCFRIAHTIKEEVRATTEFIHRRECDRHVNSPSKCVSNGIGG